MTTDIEEVVNGICRKTLEVHLKHVLSHLIGMLRPDEDVQAYAYELMIGDEGVLLVTVESLQKLGGPRFGVLGARNGGQCRVVIDDMEADVGLTIDF